MDFSTLFTYIYVPVFVLFSRCHQSCRIQSSLCELAPHQNIFAVFSKVLQMSIIVILKKHGLSIFYIVHRICYQWIVLHEATCRSNWKWKLVRVEESFNLFFKLACCNLGTTVVYTCMLQVKIKFFCLLTLLIYWLWIIRLEDKGNWESN